ncbi:MAG: FMN-binding protein [Desulfobulbaceae bacterium]|nr:FMN-binding protein [Desulfobulbaceae bacterium]HIJ77931.1 FMN-binding protein [Deltaproteobacteria bacterium]
MKDIMTIVFRLTVSCLLAGLVMGTAFIFTSKAKKHNEHVNEQKVMFSLLGYTADQAKPASLALHEVYRYVVTDQQGLSVGYLVPMAGEDKAAYTFVAIGLDGAYLGSYPVALAQEEVSELGPRDQAIAAALGPEKTIRYADETIVVTNNGKRQAYLLPGEFPGFKTFIKVIMAVDQSFTVIGLEIMEHEEDPGLGGEIVQNYFKNQFKGKSFTALKKLGVAKVPLPDDYLKALDADKYGLTAADVAAVQELYQDKDIYALTGATISSRSVTNGVKGIVKKFAYRVSILDKVLAEQQIAVPF